MFNNISWGSYCFALFITIIIYYFFVIIAFYRHELSNYFEDFNKKFTSSGSPDFSPVESMEDPHESAFDIKNEFKTVQDILADLSEIIRQASERQYPKAELIQALRVKLNSYQKIFSNEQKTQVEATIIKDCNRYCSMHLEGEDRKVLWLD